MTTFKPAHKVVGDANKPGQLSFDRHPYLKSPNCEQDKPEGSETTLAHYIARKQRDDAFASVAKEKKRTYQEWVNAHQDLLNQEMFDGLDVWETIWNAAQKNV